MEPDFIGFFQERITRAYQEQVWAVAIVGSMNAFIASHAAILLNCFQRKRWPLQIAVAVISLLALGFVWSRHFIFVHYDNCLKALLELSPKDSLCSDRVQPLHAFVARWSGVSLYSLIILCLCIIAVRMIAKAKPRA